MKNTNLADILRATADFYGERLALVSQRQSLTYRQLIIRSARTANLLRQEGVGPGAIVGIALSDPCETIVAIAAMWMLDCTPTVLDFRSRADERARIAATFRLNAVLQERRPPGVGEYPAIEANADWRERIERQSASIESVPVQSDALISLTSGTTGAPQGLRLTHATLYDRLLLTHSESGDTTDSIYLNPLPINFAASRNHTLAKLFGGGTIHFAPILATAGELCEYVLSTGATFTLMVPLQASGILELTAGRAAPIFPNLKTFYCSGARVSSEISQRAQREISPGYRVLYGSGITGTIAELRGADILQHSESVGRALPFVLLQIVDDEGNELSADSEGQIRIKSPILADGVIGAAVETSDKVVDGWAYPGDIGSKSSEGFITLHGRASDLIIRGGVNVHPEEIEAVLRLHSKIADVAVSSLADERVGEEIAAFVVAAAPVSTDELDAFIRARLASDKRPRRYVFVDSLPRNAMGKLLRRSLSSLVE